MPILQNEEMETELSAVGETEEEAVQKLLELIKEKQQPAPVVRPKISFPRILLGFLLPVSITVLNVFLFTQRQVVWIFLTVLVGTVILFAKPFVILMILLYQKIAPKKIRCRCRYTPCCSNYTLQAIQKYGLLKGLFKGLKRIFRCYPPNGGIDYP